MCGIVGYTGPREAGPILMAGLKRLEYRGYDSAGIALVDEDGALFRRRLGFSGLQVRQGKRFEIEVDGEVTPERLDDIRRAAETLLANTVIESFDVRTQQ